MVGYKDLAVVALLIGGGYLIMRQVNQLGAGIAGAFTSITNTIDRSSQAIYDRTTMVSTSTERIIEANKDSMNPAGYLYQMVGKDPYGSSILPNWQLDRRQQVNQPINIENIWGDINRMHSQTVPTNEAMLASIQFGHPKYFDNIRGFANQQGYSSGGTSIVSPFSSNATRPNVPRSSGGSGGGTYPNQNYGKPITRVIEGVSHTSIDRRHG